MGDVMKKIFELSWPVMLGMILQNLLGTVDLFFVGKLGTTELAAVGLVNTMVTVIFVFSNLISSGAIAFITRRYGEGDEEGVRVIAGQSYMLSVLIGCLVSIVTVLSAYSMIELFYSPDKATLMAAYTFAIVIFSGTFIGFINSTLKTVLQGTGDTKTPLYIFCVANVMNMILDPLFMFVFKLGIQGAAWATVLSNITACILLNKIVLKKYYSKDIKVLISYFIPRIKVLKQTLGVGSWSCLQQIARPLTGMLMTSLVFSVGGITASAAFGIGSQVLNYTFIFLNGLSVAITILVGQNLGKKQVSKCKAIVSEGMKFACLNMIIFGILYLIFPRFFIRILSPDLEVIHIGVNYLRIVYVGVIFVIIPEILGGVFRGAGDTFPPMVASIIANVVFKVPMAYVFAITFKLGINGIWWAIALSVVVEAICILGYFKKGTWKEKIL